MFALLFLAAVVLPQVATEYMVVPGRRYQLRPDAPEAERNLQLAGYHPPNSDCKEWRVHSRSTCSVTCGAGSRVIDVYCRSSSGRWYYSSKVLRCQEKPCPPLHDTCPISEIVYSSYWSACSATCGRGTQQRARYCWKQTHYHKITPENRNCEAKCFGDQTTPKSATVSASTLPSTTAVQRSTTTKRPYTERQTTSGASSYNARDAEQKNRESWETRTLLGAGCVLRHGVHIDRWSHCSARCGSGVQHRRRFCWHRRQYWVTLAQENRKCFSHCGTRLERHSKRNGRRQTKSQNIGIQMTASVFYSDRRQRKRERLEA